MTTSPMPMDAATRPVSPAPYITIQEHLLPSRPCSPFAASFQVSPHVSTVLSSPPPSPELRQHTSSLPSSPANISLQTSESHCLAEQRLRSSFEQHQQYQQQMRKRLSLADHLLQLGPEAAQRYQHQLALQLEYYKQLQIMHSQRARDIELLHLQQQRLHQQQPQTFQMVKRFQLAQRMLQMQQLYHAQQIQKIQYLQKINRLQRPPTPGAEAEQTPFQAVDHVNEEDMAKLDINPNTPHIPTSISNPVPARTPGLPRTHGEILGPAGQVSPVRQSRVQELSRIVLPSPDQIRKLRHQRLKYQARLRQAAADRPKVAHQQHVNTNSDNTTLDASELKRPGTSLSMNTDTPSSSSSSSSLTLSLSSSSPNMEAAQIAKHVQATVWTSSTTSVLTRSKADLHYKSQLRRSMALQQHMIQDHTHRYRIYQAFCLLQRAREAQALDELQTQQRRQLQTLAWVEALRNSKELEIPQ